MKCILRYKTDKTPELKHKWIQCKSIKEAERLFEIKNSTENITKARITYFDGWKERVKKVLK